MVIIDNDNAHVKMVKYVYVNLNPTTVDDDYFG